MQFNQLLSVASRISEAVLLPLSIILWGLTDIFFILIDFTEIVFRKFVGLDHVYYNGEKVEGDIVTYLIHSSIVQDIFMSIIIFGLFMLIILTTFAIIRNQYVDKPKPISGIISNSFKGLLMFLMVPIAVMVCMLVGNVVLQAVDGATSAHVDSEATSSDMLFIAAAYNANVIRSSDLPKVVLREIIVDPTLSDETRAKLNALGINSVLDVQSVSDETLEKVADIIDNDFVTGRISKLGGVNGKWDYNAVSKYYSMFRFSFITAWVGGGVMLGLLINITWGMLGRIFKMLFYYVLSPAIIAMYPLDEGAALKSWTKEFSKQATLAYSSVAGMNLFYSLLPVIKQIKMFEGVFGFFGNQLIQLLITLTALYSVKSLIGSLSGWFGLGEAHKEGAEVKKLAKEKLSNFTGTVTGTVGGAIGGYKGVPEGAKGTEKFFSTMMGAYKGAGMDKVFDIGATNKKFNEAYKAGGEYYKDLRTNTMFIERNKKEKARFEELAMEEKENKRIAAEIAKVTAGYDALIADPSTTPAKAQEYKDAKEAEIAKIIESAEYLKILTDEQRNAAELMQKSNEKRSQNFTGIDQMRSSMTILKREFDKIVRDDGIDDTDANWQKFITGEFDNITQLGMTVGNAYGKDLSDKLQGTVYDLERARTVIKNLAESSESGKKYVEGVLGTAEAGLVTSGGALTITQSRDILTKAAQEQQAINEEAKKAADEIKEARKAAVEYYDGTRTISDTDREKIAKNMKK